MPVLSLLLAAAMLAHGPLPETVVPAIDEAPTKAGSYNWMERHEKVDARVRQGNVGMILVGDSITHGWGGSPDDVRGDSVGQLWTTYFASRNAVNEGFGWDRTQHVLWRFDHGEIDGISPKVAVVMIGTNNIGVNTSADIEAGITAIVDELHHKLRRTKVLLLAIFPRGEQPTDPARRQVAEVNALLAAHLAHRSYVTYLDLTQTFLQPDGTITRETMGDFLHPTAAGYDRWVKAMEPTLAKLYGDQAKG